MNKSQIVDALSAASIYTISGEIFIEKIKKAGVTSYVINIYNYSVTFRGSTITANNEIVIFLIKTNDNGDPLFVHLLKKEAVTHYEVFLADMRMVYYKSCGTVKEF